MISVILPGATSAGILAVDVGTTNIGVCYFAGNKVITKHIRGEGVRIANLLKSLDDILNIPATGEVKNVVIERYVPYSGVNSSSSEPVNMLIGMLCLIYRDVEVSLVRAVEWKFKILKMLYKERVENGSGFSNTKKPGDKNVSIDIFRHVTGDKSKITNHEADAFCMAYLKYMEDIIQ